MASVTRADAVGLSQVLRGCFGALRGVNLVHGVLDLMRKGDLSDKRRDKGEAVGVHLFGYGGVDVFCDVVLLGKDFVEGVDGDGRAQGVGDEVAHLSHRLLQHVVALIDAGLLRCGAEIVTHVVLSGDLKADGYVVLGLHVDVKAVFHGAQAYRGCLAVHEGNLGVEARAHNPC